MGETITKKDVLSAVWMKGKIFHNGAFLDPGSMCYIPSYSTQKSIPGYSDPVIMGMGDEWNRAAEKLRLKGLISRVDVSKGAYLRLTEAGREMLKAFADAEKPPAEPKPVKRPENMRQDPPSKGGPVFPHEEALRL